MKVENQERLPRPYRDGKLSALNECLGLIADEGLTGGALYGRIARQFWALCPPAYRTYCDRFRQMQAAERAAAGPFLLYNKWRRLTAAAREEAQLCEIVGAAAGAKLAQMRRRLLLAEGEPPDDQAAWPFAVQAAEQERDGRLDGCLVVMGLMDDEKLDGEPLGDRICRLIFDAWPADYLEYRQRYQAFFSGRHSPADIGPALEYAEWRDAVDRLHAESARRSAQSGRPSKLWLRLSILLLRAPGEPEPQAD